MTLGNHRRLAVVPAGLALVVMVVPLFVPSARSSGPGPAVILDGRTPAEPTSAKVNQGAIGSPIEVYRSSCSACHDNDGRGAVVRDDLPAIPDFTDAKWHASRSDAELSRSILEGKAKAMPRMKAKLGTVDVMLMVALVRGFKDGKQVIDDESDPSSTKDPKNETKSQAEVSRPGPSAEKEAAIQEGGGLFQKSCVRCHGRDGKGDAARDSLATIPDFTLRAWQQKRSDAQLLVSILDGKGTGMPAFRDKIARERARIIVTYIREFAPGASRPTASETDDFETRFNKLANEFEELARQIRALGDATPAEPKAPQSKKQAPKKQ